MKGKNLYIISGPNGAGKTTASYTVLPKILNCKEFVNADEIARGLSPFNPDGMAIEAGLNNLFDIYMPIVDSWILVNNSQTPRIIVALGGKNHTTKIEDKECFTKIKEYVNQRT